MNVNITNRTSYNQICLIINNKEYTICKYESISVCITDSCLRVKVFVIEKNKVLINWLFALIDGFVSEESVVNSLVCNLTFDIVSYQTDTLITLKDLQYRDDNNGYIYNSVYVDCNNNTIANLSYELTDTQAVRKKSLFYYIGIVSWMPVLFVLLILTILFEELGYIFAGALLFIVFSVPSFKKAYKTKKFNSTEYANEVLLSQFDKQKANYGNPVIPEPKGFIEKTIHKILDFIFKKK